MPASMGRSTGERKVRSPLNTRVMYQPSGFVSATIMTQKRMICSQPITVMELTLQASGARSEPLGPQQRVSEVEQEAERNGAGERIIEDHGPLLQSRSQA